MEERKTLIPVKELAKRYALFIISLFISALGVAITKKGEFGVSPISSVADVVMNSGEAFVKAGFRYGSQGVRLGEGRV